ncbi:MAG: GNAT family N-acetyltransferase [Bacteroidota bacterium]
MKIFFSESNNDYSSYTFNYAVYAVKESNSDLPTIYDKGFLPYSSDPSLTLETYYLARSLRVDLSNFADTSENRRVHRKMEHLDIQVKAIPKEELMNQPDFFDFCLVYAQERFSNNAMDGERLKYILARESANTVLTFTSNGKVTGYVLAIIHDNFFHYWYAFFDTSLLKEYPIGKWIMWRSLHWAKEKGLAHVYLGTCYGKSALYKARDFRGLEFFDGMQWNNDVKLLKSLCKSDEEKKEKDRFKEMEGKNDLLLDWISS